jgi:hypothetical protein
MASMTIASMECYIATSLSRVIESISMDIKARKHCRYYRYCQILQVLPKPMIMATLEPKQIPLAPRLLKAKASSDHRR